MGTARNRSNTLVGVFWLKHRLSPHPEILWELLGTGATNLPVLKATYLAHVLRATKNLDGHRKYSPGLTSMCIILTA